MVAAIDESIQREDARAQQAGGMGLPAGRALLVVAPWQSDLKKVTLRLFWQPEGGAGQVFERSIYVHRAAAGP